MKRFFILLCLFFQLSAWENNLLTVSFPRTMDYTFYWPDIDLLVLYELKEMCKGKEDIHHGSAYRWAKSVFEIFDEVFRKEEYIDSKALEEQMIEHCSRSWVSKDNAEEWAFETIDTLLKCIDTTPED